METPEWAVMRYSQLREAVNCGFQVQCAIVQGRCCRKFAAAAIGGFEWGRGRRHPGARPDPPGVGKPLPEHLLRPNLWHAEIVYFPLGPALLKAARSRGRATVNGGTVAVGQALGAFELFTGRKAHPARIEVHFGRLNARGDL